MLDSEMQNRNQNQSSIPGPKKPAHFLSLESNWTQNFLVPLYCLQRGIETKKLALGL